MVKLVNIQFFKKIVKISSKLCQLPLSSPLLLYHIYRKCFGEHIESVEQAIHELSVEDGNGNKWATQALQSIRKSSPTSLKVTFEQLRRGRTLDAAECFNMEFRIVIGCMRNNDFREGVRALLVDKDNSPKWQPATLEEVSKDYLESFFQPLGEYELNLRSNK